MAHFSLSRKTPSVKQILKMRVNGLLMKLQHFLINETGISSNPDEFLFLDFFMILMISSETGEKNIDLWFMLIKQFSEVVLVYLLIDKLAYIINLCGIVVKNLLN